MRINISFPSVMKMIFSTSIDVDEPISLVKVKERIFDIFWKTMESFSPSGIHGSPDQVILKDAYGIEILSEFELEERIRESHNFQVVFKGH